MFKLDLQMCMDIHQMFNANCLKLYKPSMLDNEEEESVPPIPKKLVTRVSAWLEVDLVLQHKE